jgi:hypothetical protein
VLRNARLRVLYDDDHDQTVALPPGEFAIGRDAENDLVLPMEGVSRRHARLHLEEGRYWITDCGSKNGVFVNGQKSDRKILEDQDCLQIGPVRLFFVLTENSAARPEPPPGASGKVHQPNPMAAALNIERKKRDEDRWREFLMVLFLKGAQQLSHAGAASLWFPEISGELAMQRQLNAGKGSSAPLSHEPWQPLVETVFQSGGIILRERGETTNLAGDNFLAITNRAHRILGIPLRTYDRPGAPAGVLLLESVRSNGRLAKPEAQRLQQLVERSVVYLAQMSRDEYCQKRPEPEAGPGVSINAAAGNVGNLAASPYDLAWASRPSGADGGDYLEVIALNETELVIAIGDVAGKGVAAAKMRDRLQTSLRMHLLFESRPEALVQELNQLAFTMSSTTTFTTLFLGVLNLQRGVLCYVNAGHNPGVIIYPPTATPYFELLRSSGAALGVLEKNAMAENEIAIPPGATLIFYTDGVTEATGADGKQYGLTRLIECATAAIFSQENLSASRLLNLVLDDLPHSAAPATGVSQPGDDRRILVMIARAKSKKR